MAEFIARVLVELGVLSALVAFVANRWSARYTAGLKAAHDRALATMQSRLSHQVNVSKVQFDTEFLAASLIWERVHAAREAYLKAVIPTARHIEDEPAEPTAKDEWLKKRVNALVDARNEFQSTVFRYQPFYPRALFDAYAALIDMMQVTFNQIFRDRWEHEWFNKNDERREAFVNAADRIETMIRERFASLRIADTGEGSRHTEST